MRYQFGDAERCLEKAIRLAPNKAEILATAGRLAIELGNLQLAERFFKQAIEQKNVAPETLARLAELYERSRRPEEAAAMAERALQLDKTCPLALLTQAKLYRQAGKLTDAEQVLRLVLTTPNRELQIRGYYELGALLDRQGRFDEAMAAFLEAKAILKPDAIPFSIALQTLQERLKLLAETITAEMLQRWFDLGTRLLPSHRLALLGGHPRSGTTLLEQVLDAHPDIISSEETMIFHYDAYRTLARKCPPNSLMLPVLESSQLPEILQARKNYYHSMELSLGPSSISRVLIDKNPSLTFLIPALIRIFPEIKLLIALRDPRDVILSCFMQPFFPLAQTNSAYLTLCSAAREYAVVMGVWLALKPLLKNPWLEVRYEDMVEDLESVARKSLDFLGVSWDAKVLGFDEHARKKVVRSPTYADVTQPVYKRAKGRWRNYQKYLEPHLAKLEPFVKAFGYE
jgi:tetratricopeptide (TPR) repeat protein